MSVPLFRDFDKSANDLLTKGYNSNEIGFEFQAKKGSDNTDTVFKITGTNKLEGQSSNLVEATETWKNKGLTLKLSCRTDKIPTYNVELSTKNKYLDGLNLTVTSKFSEDKNENEIKATYTDKKFFNLELIGNHSPKPFLYGSIVAAYESLRLGVSGTANISKTPSLNQYSVRLGYFPSCCTYGYLFFDSNGNTAGSRLYYKKKKLQTSLEVAVKTNSLGDTPKITTALQYDVDPVTTLKTRFSNSKTLDLSLKQKLNDTITTTASTQLSEISSSGVKAKFGLLINIDI